MTGPVKASKKRILMLFFFCCLFFVLLILRLGWIQVVDAQKYSDLAVEQQTRDTPITAVRGNIYDRNMEPMAINAPTYTIWVWPSELKDDEGDPDAMAAVIADIIQGDPVSIKASLTKESSLVRVAKNLTREQAEEIRALAREDDEGNVTLPGISVVEETKRYYPSATLASHVIGHTTDDNNGISGIELRYNDYLSGMSGRIIRNTDASGRQLAYGTERYYEAEDGLNVVLTIDEALQYYLENALKNAYEATGAIRTAAIAMDPDTGEVLAMGQYPGYDLNNPRVPILEEDLEEYEALETTEEQTEYWNQMWRNFLISDTYEPGSPFKLVTTAIALEEGLTNVSEGFYCSGHFTVAGEQLSCWSSSNPHGAESLAEAVQNSCNPVFAELARRIGKEKFYEYLETFGFTQRTGIDFTGEAYPIVNKPENIGPVELATISYGQGISISPIQMITAVSSIVNGGNLMRPTLVRAVTDDEGNIIYNNAPELVRHTVSEQTSKEMREIMESVVSEGGGKIAYIPGYRVGGKTGTADKVVDGKYKAGATYGSFLAIAPSEDPEIIVLLMADEPYGTHFGSQTAAPYVKEFLEEALPYLGVAPEYTPEEEAMLARQSITVADVVGRSAESAANALGRQGLQAVILPEQSDPQSEVLDQYPKAGEKVESGSTVFIYTE